jgi:PAS domain S-box-containing protein
MEDVRMGPKKKYLLIYESPFGLIAIVALSIFVAETVSMFVIYSMRPFSSELTETLFDSSFLLILLTPILYLFLLRPMLLNITERKKSEEVRGRLAAIVDSAEDAIISEDLNGIIQSWNMGAENIFGYKAEEVIGKPVSIIVPPEHTADGYALLAPFYQPDKMPTILEKSRRGETLAAYDTSCMRKDGTLVNVLLTESPVKDSMGKIIGAAAIVHNITDRKQLEQRIIQYSKELEQSNRELDNFASIAAHDLRAPLRGVMVFSDLLRKSYEEKLDAEADQYIAHIVEGAGRMQHLIDDLLQYARAGTRGQPLVPVDANAIIEKALDNLMFEINESSAVITADHLPTVYADTTQLIQLFQNLVGNAVKYRSNAPRIHISAERKDREWLFKFSDNGIGIDTSQFERIFEIFQRLHTRDEYSGTGIGLAICKKIVERFGGRIWVESKLGQGSSFFFTLPIAGNQPGRQED